MSKFPDAIKIFSKSEKYISCDIRQIVNKRRIFLRLIERKKNLG